MGAPVNVAELGTGDFKKFLDSFDHVFSDCDGVLWNPEPLQGTGEFFKRMKQHGKTVHYVSNNSVNSKEQFDNKFNAANIENGFESLIIPSVAIAEYLKSVNFNKKVYCVAASQSIKMLQSYGFECIEGPHLGPDYYQDYDQFLDDDMEIGAVVLDTDFRVNLAKITRALTYLKRPDVIFLNGSTDRYVPYRADRKGLATGAFVDLIVLESKREPIQMGKPGKVFGKFTMRKAGVTDPSRVLFIGDTIEQDIGFGKNLGFKTLLVLTNKSKADMLAHETIKPDYYADCLGSILPLL